MNITPLPASRLKRLALHLCRRRVRLAHLNHNAYPDTVRITYKVLWGVEYVIKIEFVPMLPIHDSCRCASVPHGGPGGDNLD